ncbi:hypothetical protein NX059_011826 [Plenodomus lindquistii]|nr:hypothetical protein NX059_011826 [Plenodomus lindquistii]
MSGDPEGPKWRLEHATNNRAVCNQAACKRGQVKIAKGELRIGTNTLFDNDMEQRWYIAWRHWGCATKHQIAGMKELTGGDPSKATGFDGLSTESQEQVRLAFEAGKPVDKEFKGVREDLAVAAPRHVREYTDAQGYKADVARRSAACRGTVCSQTSAKVLKGELRLGILVDYDGDHSSWYYKHWECMSEYDLDQAKERFDNDEIDNTFDGIDTLPEEYQQVVIDTFTTGEIVKPPKPEPPKPKKSRVKSKEDVEVAEPAIKKEDEDGNADENENGVGNTHADGDQKPADSPKPKRSRKKRVSEEMDESEAEYVPRKTRSRQFKVGDVVGL